MFRKCNFCFHGGEVIILTLTFVYVLLVIRMQIIYNLGILLSYCE